MPSKSPKSSAGKSRKPQTKVKYRPGLATVLGRAVVLDEFFSALRNGTDAERRDLARSLNVTLDAKDLAAMNEMNWDEAAAAATSLRATLPDRDGPPQQIGPEGNDAVGW
jgi:hypothetical protein